MISTSGVSPACARLRRRRDHGADLHLVDLRIEEGQAHPAGAEHRVCLLQVAHDRGRLARVGEAVVGRRLRAGAPRPRSARGGGTRAAAGRAGAPSPEAPRISCRIAGEVRPLELAELVEGAVKLLTCTLQLGRRRPILAGRLHLGLAPAAPRRRTSRVPARRGPRRRTCARCGRARCPRRRAIALWLRPRACRRWRGPRAVATRRTTPARARSLRPSPGRSAGRRRR